jgi:RNA methyltransferase, TrmH family
MVITSNDNGKVKLIRRLRERKHRDREGLFAAEGEDLLAAGRASGREPELVLCAAGSGIEGEEVAPELLASVSILGSGTRVISVWRRAWAEPAGPVCVYLDGVADPGNVGAVIRTAHALVEGTVVLGPGCADPHSPKATRASMGSAFGQPLARAGIEATPEPRLALVAHGGDPPGAAAPPLTVCLGAERAGLRGEVVEACEQRWTIPLRRGGAESLNVAATAAIALGRISSATIEAEAT